MQLFDLLLSHCIIKLHPLNFQCQIKLFCTSYLLFFGYLVVMGDGLQLKGVVDVNDFNYFQLIKQLKPSQKIEC